jgi:Na+-transporting methylmalonyl-CoA/oxaloacetate decarboxylase gamma subunit
MDWAFILFTVLTGFAVVFAILMFLVLLLVLTGKIAVIKKKKSKTSVIHPMKKPETRSMHMSAAMKTGVLYTPKAVKKLEESFVKPRRLSEPESDYGNSWELETVAAITAAIMAFADETDKKIKIIDIKKREKSARSRTSWGAAGVSESMGGV